MSTLMGNSSSMPLGETRAGTDTISATAGELQENLGKECLHEHLNWGDSDPKTQIDMRCIRTREVRNESGGTLARRLQVRYGTGAGDHGINVNALAGNNEWGAGIIDPFLNTTVADNGICHIITEGPCDVESAGDESLTPDQRVVSAASGQVNLQTAAPASDTAVMLEVNTFVGIVEESATNVAGTVFRCDIARRGGS